MNLQQGGINCIPRMVHVILKSSPSAATVSLKIPSKVSQAGEIEAGINVGCAAIYPGAKKMCLP